MSDMLFDLHQDNDQKWRWFGSLPNSAMMIVSRRSWQDRSQASLEMSRFIQSLDPPEA